jgi:hypothetical protein
MFGPWKDPSEGRTGKGPYLQQASHSILPKHFSEPVARLLLE